MSDLSRRIAGLSARKQRLLEQLLQQRRGAQQARPPDFPTQQRRPGQSRFPLSFSQQRLWFLDQLEPNSAAFNIPLALGLEGRLQVAALQAAAREIVRRHETLRTRFPSRDGQPHQLIEEPGAVAIPVVDLSRCGNRGRQREVGRLTRREAAHPFDLSRGPLLRATLIVEQTSQSDPASSSSVLLLNLHHIITDGWSMGVLVREVMALYQAFCEGRRSPLPELPLQYADFAVWQRRLLEGGEQQRQLQYWKGQLQGAPASLELPTDRPRPPRMSYRGASLETSFPDGLLESLQALGRRCQATLFIVLTATLQTLLSRWTGHRDISVGTPVANRPREELEGLIGLFVNTLVLRSRLAGRRIRKGTGTAPC